MARPKSTFGKRMSSGDYTCLSQCITCKHALPTKVAPAKCKAYPAEIPFALNANQHDHRQPYPGDGGYRYEPKRPSARNPFDLPPKPKAPG